MRPFPNHVSPVKRLANQIRVCKMHIKLSLLHRKLGKSAINIVFLPTNELDRSRSS